MAYIIIAKQNTNKTSGLLQPYFCNFVGGCAAIYRVLSFTLFIFPSLGRAAALLYLVEDLQSSLTKIQVLTHLLFPSLHHSSLLNSVTRWFLLMKVPRSSESTVLWAWSSLFPVCSTREVSMVIRINCSTQQNNSFDGLPCGQHQAAHGYVCGLSSGSVDTVISQKEALLPRGPNSPSLKSSKLQRGQPEPWSHMFWPYLSLIGRT